LPLLPRISHGNRDNSALQAAGKAGCPNTKLKNGKNGNVHHPGQHCHICLAHEKAFIRGCPPNAADHTLRGR
jgi:hypothetical protein